MTTNEHYQYDPHCADCTQDNRHTSDEHIANLVAIGAASAAIARLPQRDGE